MDEAEFVNSIDCNFPYNDRSMAVAMIDQGNKISDNAMFAVLDELCRPGHSAKVTNNTLLELIDIWNDRAEHPLAEFIVPAARLMVKNTRWSVAKGITLLEQIAPFAGLYAALSIASESADDVDGILDAKGEKIRSDWDAE